MMMMISAKTPTAAKIAPMMIFVGFVSLGVDIGGVDGVVDVRKVKVSTSKPIPVLIIRTA
jgi:hypothetical protein